MTTSQSAISVPNGNVHAAAESARIPAPTPTLTNLEPTGFISNYAETPTEDFSPEARAAAADTSRQEAYVFATDLRGLALDASDPEDRARIDQFVASMTGHAEELKAYRLAFEQAMVRTD